MKNIGILIHIVGKGGAEHVAARLSNLLSKHYNVYFIVFSQQYPPSYSFSGHFINLNIPPTTNVFKRGLAAIKRIIRLRKVKKEYKLDCVISFLENANVVNVLSNNKKCKTIVSIRNYNLGKITFIDDILNNLVFKKSNKIVCCSQEIQIDLMKLYNISSKKIITIYNPFDLSSIQSLAEIKNKDINIPKGFKFVTMGRIMPQKGFWNLVKSFSILLKSNPEANLLIIGKDFSDGKLQTLVQKLEISKKVYFLGQLDNPFCILSKCDCYILSSLFEGFPNAMTEAMCCGLPIIASNCKSGPKEILDENTQLEVKDIYFAKYGIIYKEYNDFKENYTTDINKEHEILANAMKTIINDESLREKFKYKSIERANDFSYDACENKFLVLINELLN